MSSKHENCSHSNMYSAKITYTYSQFLFDAITSVDTELSDKSKYGKKGYNNAKKKAINYANYTVCVSFSGKDYSCPGHRDAVNVGVRSMTYAINYNAGDVLSCSQPDKIRQNLVFEINQRKQHALYNSQQQYSYGPYNRGDIVHHTQPNLMSQHLGSLNAFISSVSNVAPKLHNGHGDYKHGGSTYGFSSPAYRSNSSILQPMTVLSGKITQPNDLKPMQPNISVDYNDCICYSDCTRHGILNVSYCGCNINCLCNY